MFSDHLLAKAKLLLDACSEQGIKVTAAESCTGGLLSALLTEIPGCSNCFDRGFITYANSAKTEQLGVPEALIEEKGAVSEEVAIAMVEGAVKSAKATIGVSVTGVAGPTGGGERKPVGTVWIGAMREGREPKARHFLFHGDRNAIRLQSLEAAMEALEGLLH